MRSRFRAWSMRVGSVLLIVAAGAAQAGTVVVVGDSISAGHGVPANKIWVNNLAAKAQMLGHHVVNASVSADTSAGGVSRLPMLLRQHRPAVVVIALGGNDAQRGLQMKATRQNLLKMLRDSHKAGAKVLLVGMEAPPSLGPAYARQFRALYPQLAREGGATLLAGFLNNVAVDPDLMQSDGIHPNSLAQPILADNVWKGLEPMLKALK